MSYGISEETRRGGQRRLRVLKVRRLRYRPKAPIFRPHHLPPLWEGLQSRRRDLAHRVVLRDLLGDTTRWPAATTRAETSSSSASNEGTHLPTTSPAAHVGGTSVPTPGPSIAMCYGISGKHAAVDGDDDTCWNFVVISIGRCDLGRTSPGPCPSTAWCAQCVLPASIAGNDTRPSIHYAVHSCGTCNSFNNCGAGYTLAISQRR